MGHIQYKREQAVEVPGRVQNLGPEADAAYRRAVVQGKTEAQAFDAATLAGGAVSGIQTYALNDPNAPRGPDLTVETFYPDGGDGYYHPPLRGDDPCANFAYDHHALDRQVFGPPVEAAISGLNWLNEKTQLPLLVELGNDAQSGLDYLGDRAVANGYDDALPVLGGTSAIIAALAPQTILDIIPGGKGAKLLRTGDELGDVGAAARLDEGLSTARKELRIVDVGSRKEFRAVSFAAEPNTTYRFDGFEYTTDDFGRGISSSGVLRDNAGNNRFYDDYLIGHLGIDGDIGFHGGADRFGFQGGPLNVSPGSAELNSKAYARFEDQLADVVSSGRTVEADFQRIFNPGNISTRPDKYRVIYRIDGGTINQKIFLNRPGG